MRTKCMGQKGRSVFGCIVSSAFHYWIRRFQFKIRRRDPFNSDLTVVGDILFYLFFRFKILRCVFSDVSQHHPSELLFGHFPARNPINFNWWRRNLLSVLTSSNSIIIALDNIFFSFFHLRQLFYLLLLLYEFKRVSQTTVEGEEKGMI